MTIAKKNPWAFVHSLMDHLFLTSTGFASNGLPAAPLPGAKAADETSDHGGAQCDPAAVPVMMVPVVMMRVTRRRGRRCLVVTLRSLVMPGGGRLSVSASTARSGKARSREGEASKKRCENFECLVHITPSLSVLLLCAFRAYNLIGDGAAKT